MNHRKFKEKETKNCFLVIEAPENPEAPWAITEAMTENEAQKVYDTFVGMQILMKAHISIQPLLNLSKREFNNLLEGKIHFTRKEKDDILNKNTPSFLSKDTPNKFNR